MTCPACENRRRHAPEDWAHHPYAGHGYVAGHGWTHPDLARAAQAGAATSNNSGEGLDAAAPVARGE